MHMGSRNVAHWAEVAPHKLDKIKIALVQLTADLMEGNALDIHFRAHCCC